jgi:hypothetical protein
VKHCVFVHTNHRQMVGALVSQYSLKRNSRSPNAFDVRIIDTKDHRFLHAREGQYYLRDGVQRQWLIEDLQSFTPLRFMPAELMGYEGRAVVIDPDVFAVGDVNGLLTRDMGDKALFCRAGKGRKSFASSVMLLDCAKLTHWRTGEQFDEMFESKRDYMDWISLKLEPSETIGLLEPEWNDFDHLDENTKLLHNTKRWNQPWKTGLPVDFTPTEGSGVFRAMGWLRRARASLFGRYALLGQYQRHWDPNQEHFFFGLLRECLEKGVISEAMLREEMERNHVRHDAFEVLERTPRLAA